MTKSYNLNDRHPEQSEGTSTQINFTQKKETLAQCPIELPNDAVSDTTDDDSSNAAGNKKNNHAYNDAWLIIF